MLLEAQPEHVTTNLIFHHAALIALGDDVLHVMFILHALYNTIIRLIGRVG